MEGFVAPETKAIAATKIPLPCPFTAQGMLQPSHNQPPPMFGPRGATIPPKHMNTYKPRPFGQNSNETGNRPKFQPRNNHQQRPRFQQNHHHQPINDKRPNYFHQPNSDGTTVSREFYCETCDRDFRSADLLAEHREQHQRCGIDGCKFEGHEAIVSKHIQQQHSTGLYDKIKNLNTPEDIEKWREERRKRYPTTKNVELRQQIQEAKNKRGERLEDSKSRFGKKCDRRSGPGAATSQVAQPGQTQKEDQKKKRRKRKANNRVEKDEKVEEVKVVKEVITNGSLVMFGGTSGFKNYKRPRVEVKNALAGLLGDYGSDESDTIEEDDTAEESDDDEPCTAVVPDESKPDEPQSEVIDYPTENEPTHLIDATDDSPMESSTITIDPNDDEAPEEASVQRVSDLPVVEEDTKPQPQKRQRNNADISQTAKNPKPTTILDLSKRYRNQNTMLEKLLQKDIRHERNVLLQCVRHVVENNFFGIGQTKDAAPKSETEPLK